MVLGPNAGVHATPWPGSTATTMRPSPAGTAAAAEHLGVSAAFPLLPPAEFCFGQRLVDSPCVYHTTYPTGRQHQCRRSREQLGRTVMGAAPPSMAGVGQVEGSLPMGILIKATRLLPWHARFTNGRFTSVNSSYRRLLSKLFQTYQRLCFSSSGKGRFFFKPPNGLSAVSFYRLLSLFVERF